MKLCRCRCQCSIELDTDSFEQNHEEPDSQHTFIDIPATAPTQDEQAQSACHLM